METRDFFTIRIEPFDDRLGLRLRPLSILAADKTIEELTDLNTFQFKYLFYKWIHKYL